MRSLILLLGLALLISDSIAQTVSGLVSSPTIGTQETVAYTLEISDANASEIDTPNPPDAEGLVLVSNTASRGTSMSIINGQVSRSVSYTWRYRPEQEGEARILGATVMIAGASYSAPPVAVSVVPQSQRPQRRRRSPFGGFSLFDDPTPAAPPPEVTDRDIFIRASQSSQEAYQNEQLTLDYKLFFRPETLPRNTRLADSWDAEGFWREDLKLPDSPVPEVVVENGIRYQAISIRRVAVFPTRPGELSIDPLKIAVEVQSPDMDPFSTPLFSRSHTLVERASPTLNIRSKDLPSNPPNGFTGAVGQYALSAELSQNELEVGEALQLTAVVEGVGNIALIETPSIDPPGIFEVYDPEVNSSKSENGNLIRGKKTFTWLMVPRSNGTFQIPPIQFVFFDPSQEDYVVRSVPLDPITITGTTPTALAVTSTASGFPVDDIAVLKRNPRWITIRDNPLYRTTWFYLLLTFPILALGVTALLRQRVTRLSTDTVWARNRKAHPLARKHLKNAKKLLAVGDPHQFYTALEQAILGFLGNRLNINERGQTRFQLAQLLGNVGLSANMQAELIEFLDACDAARFAPIPPDSAQMKEHLNQATHLLSAVANELESVTT